MARVQGEEGQRQTHAEGAGEGSSRSGRVAESLGQPRPQTQEAALSLHVRPSSKQPHPSAADTGALQSPVDCLPAASTGSRRSGPDPAWLRHPRQMTRLQRAPRSLRGHDQRAGRGRLGAQTAASPPQRASGAGGTAPRAPRCPGRSLG